jgi:hypothetical protein
VPAQRAPPDRRGPLRTSWLTGPRSPLDPLPCSSPTLVARAVVDLAGAASPRAAVCLRPPPPHGTERHLASSSFPLPQPALGALPLLSNWPLNSPPLNCSSADRSPPHRPPPFHPEPIYGSPRHHPSAPHPPTLLSPSTSHTECRHRTLLSTAASSPRRLSAQGEPTTRVPAPPFCLPYLRSKSPYPRAAARPSSGRRPL